ncbi:MAG: tetratricopeptide repeat protein [Deltaproteobacteria bacterium]|nr:tetratricopeptide repeat protein [Deltaproteobacteria bacterium]
MNRIKILTGLPRVFPSEFFSFWELFIPFAVLLFFLSSCSFQTIQKREAEILYEKGQTLLSRGHFDEAFEEFEKSLLLSKKAKFMAGVAHNLNEMGIIHTKRGEYIMARKEFNEAMEIYKNLNMEPETSKSLNNIASTYVLYKDFEGAIKRFEELIKWDEKSGNSLGVAITLNNMGLLYEHHLGKNEEAKRRYLQALTIFRELGNKKQIQSVEKSIERLIPK